MADILVKLDTETRSGTDIDNGRMRYLRDPQAALLMMGYRIGPSPTVLWEPGMDLPDCFKNPDGYTFMAFNAQFDMAVLNTVGQRYGFAFTQRNKWVDVMAVAARYGLPQSLDKLGKALKVKMQKMARGTYLKNKICKPPFKYTPEEYQEFREYCIRDVDSMDEIVGKLPSDRLSDVEQSIWEDTAAINVRGVPVDVRSVGQVRKIVDYYIDKQTKRVPAITQGEVNTIHQRQKIIDWCASQGFNLPNLQAETIKGIMRNVNVVPPPSVRKLLRIRQLIGGAAVKKFRRLDDMVVDGRIHDNLRYHGAGTGRTTGGGFQMLNMPRAKVKPDGEQSYDEAVVELLAQFYDVTILQDPDPMEQAKKLVRPMLKSGPGKILMAADWGSIEYILLMYYCGEWDKVDKFRAGRDPYIDFATELFHVAYEDVTDQQRQESKPPVLGSGYMLSWGGLIGYADGYGVAMTEEQAQFATNTYRNNHENVVKTWYALRDCALGAVQQHRQPFKTRDTRFLVEYDRTGRHWLIMTLPSGRDLYYCEPRLTRGKYGIEIEHRGVDPYTKQWGWVRLGPQRIIENVIQSLGRDILNLALPKINAAGYTVVAHVYDEVLCEEPDSAVDERFELMKEIMCEPPKWMPELPLRADGWVGQRYRKD